MLSFSSVTHGLKRCERQGVAYVIETHYDIRGRATHYSARVERPRSGHRIDGTRVESWAAAVGWLEAFASGREMGKRAAAKAAPATRKNS